MFFNNRNSFISTGLVEIDSTGFVADIDNSPISFKRKLNL